ncbi:hypothetical protein [Enhygromyxa salina]|uniref:Uncharacterized protein n=1 Tax=Enhygromyxa salina TaxID=215803 RepID=A0A2S9YN65_9BACT|nr:hypothetical protein [Enhygromyxa salina]PRQ06525.1 hypothetical protein ENSA7_38450 [Enhygromyxa salina]
MVALPRLAWGLAIAGAIVCGAGLAVELSCHTGHLDPDSPWRSGLSLSYEGNLPTWYSAGLLWTAALGLGLCGWSHDRPERKWWVALAAIFLLMSLDESIELHEELYGLALGGALYFSWVVPGAAITLCFCAAYLRFWLGLPTPTRRGFAAAFVIYVGGALGMELPLGLWFERHGNENLGYASLDFVEESMEIAGLSVFLLVIAGYLRDRAPFASRYIDDSSNTSSV